MSTALETIDPTIAYQLWRARAQQDSCIELSASRNYVSATAWQAAGLAAFDNVIAHEARPAGAGIECVTETIERVCTTRAATLFGAQYASLRANSLSHANHLLVLATTKPGGVVLDLVRHTERYVGYALRMNVIGQLELTHATPIATIDGQPDYDACEAAIAYAQPSLVRVMPAFISTRIDFARVAKLTRAVGAVLAADLSDLAAPIAARRMPSPLGSVDLATAPTHGPLRGPRGALLLAAARGRDALERTVQTYCTTAQPLRVQATQAVALKEALQDSFMHYCSRMIECADAIRRAFVKRGLPVVNGASGSHLVLLECSGIGIAADDLAQVLARAHINVERHRTGTLYGADLPIEQIALSSAALAARGLRPAEAGQVAHMIADLIANIDCADVFHHVRQRVVALCSRYPVDGWLSA